MTVDVDELDALRLRLSELEASVFKSKGVFLNVACAAHAEPAEVRIEADLGGLLHVARNCLDVASRTAVGAHAHVDSSGVAEPNSSPLIIIRRSEALA